MSMETFEAKTKKWGNSVGIIIPKNILEKEGLTENQHVRITVDSQNKSFGKILWDTGKGEKWEHSTDEIMRIIDEEIWGLK